MIKTANILKTTAFVTLLGASSLLMAGQHSGDGAEGKHHGGKEGRYHHFHSAERGMHGERWLTHMGEKLELSDAQKEQIKAITDAASAEKKALREASSNAREAEMNAIHNRETEKNLRKLARDSADARVDMLVYGFDTEKRVDAVLTETQRAKLAEIKTERSAKMQEHKERRMEKHRERVNSGVKADSSKS